MTESSYLYYCLVKLKRASVLIKKRNELVHHAIPLQTHSTRMPNSLPDVGINLSGC